MTNPLLTVKGTLISGFIILAVLVGAIRFYYEVIA